MNRDTPPPPNFQTRETFTFCELRKHFPDVTFAFNSVVKGGSSGRKPDAHVDMRTHGVIVEVDQDQHTRCGDYSDENERVMQLCHDFGGRPVYVIRFNADAYVKDGERVRGCFKQNQLVDIPEWERRVNELVSRFRHALDTVPAKEVSVEHLFYDS